MTLSRGTHIVAALALGGALMIVSPATAQVTVEGRSPESVTAADRPFFLSLGVGANFLFSNTYNPNPYGCYGSTYCAQPAAGAGGYVTIEAGGHLVPVGEHPGLLLTGAAAIDIGPAALSVRLGARLGFDIQLFEIDSGDIALVLTPSVLAGIAIVSGSGFGSSILIAVEPAADVHLLFLRGLFGVWIRPLAVDMQFLGSFTARWNLVAGAELRL